MKKKRQRRYVVATLASIVACTGPDECVELGANRCQSPACLDALSQAKEIVSSRGIPICEVPGDNIGIMP